MEGEIYRYNIYKYFIYFIRWAQRFCISMWAHGGDGDGHKDTMVKQHIFSLRKAIFVF